MATVISLREANQGFSRCVRDAENGQEFVITRNGTPVARLVPVLDDRGLTPKRAAARARILARMEKGFSLGGETFDRDSLHDR